ncbi:MAG: hypothetical protein V1735_00515 [Nanoarchaeota archaeon]
MRKRGILPLVCLWSAVFLFSLSAALGATILDSWVFSGEQVERNGTVYQFQLDGSGERLRIISDIEEVYVRINNSEVGPDYEYYFLGKRLANDSRPQAHVKIVLREPAVNVTLTATNRTPLLGSTVVFSGKINNSGGRIIDTYVFRLNLSPGFEGTSAEEGIIEDNIFILDGSELIIGDIVEYRVEAVAVSGSKSSLKGKLNYSFGLFNRGRNSSVLNMTPKKTLNVTARVTPRNVSVGSEVLINITARNVDNVHAVTLTEFRILIDSNLSVVSAPSIRREGDYYLDSGTISAGGKRNYLFTVKPAVGGTHLKPWNFTYKVEGVTLKESGLLNFSAKLVPLKVRIRFSSDRAKLSGGQDSYVQVSLINNDSSIRFYDVKYVVTSNVFPPKQGEVQSIAPRDQADVYSYDFVTPFSETDLIYNISVQVDYRNYYGNEFAAANASRMNITKTAFAHDLVVNRSAPAQLSAGSNGTVIVLVKNIGPHAIENITTAETLTNLALASGGLKNTLTLLHPGETKEVNRYTVRLVNASRNASISWLMTYAELKLPYRLQNTTKVQSVKADQATTPKTPPKNETSTKKDEAQVTGFQKLLRSIDRFFTSLFT